MREILFKAKATNREEGREYRTNYKNGDWIHGLVTSLDNYYLPSIAEMTNTDGVSRIEVLKETICQWTGLVDVNGVKIFEGDLVTIENTKKQGMPACVRWEQKNCQFVASRTGYQPINLGCFEDKTQWVVCGNIHDDKAVEE